MAHKYKDTPSNVWKDTASKVWDSIPLVTYIRKTFIERYHISAIPAVFTEKYSLVEEKDVVVPDGYRYQDRIKLVADNSKINADSPNFMSLVVLDQDRVFDMVRDHMSPSLPSRSLVAWVSTTGNDTNSGTEDAPFRTIGYALQNVASDTYIRIFPGVYTESENVLQFSFTFKFHLESTTGD